MRWTQIADEMSRHRHYRNELSSWRKKDLRCTAHTTISLSSHRSMLKNKKVDRGKTNDNKNWLGGCPQYSHTSQLVNTQLNWPWFHKCIQFSTGLSCKKKFGETSYFKSFHQDREITISCRSILQHSHSYNLLYNRSVRSTERYPWSHKSTSGGHPWGIGKDYTQQEEKRMMGWGTCIFQQCAFFLSPYVCFSSSSALVKMLLSLPQTNSERNHP